MSSRIPKQVTKQIMKLMVQKPLGKVVAMATDIQQDHQEAGSRVNCQDYCNRHTLIAETVWKQFGYPGQGYPEVGLLGLIWGVCLALPLASFSLPQYPYKALGGLRLQRDLGMAIWLSRFPFHASIFFL